MLPSLALQVVISYYPLLGLVCKETAHLGRMVDWQEVWECENGSLESAAGKEQQRQLRRWKVWDLPACSERSEGEAFAERWRRRIIMARAHRYLATHPAILAQQQRLLWGAVYVMQFDRSDGPEQRWSGYSRLIAPGGREWAEKILQGKCEGAFCCRLSSLGSQLNLSLPVIYPTQTFWEPPQLVPVAVLSYVRAGKVEHQLFTVKESAMTRIGAWITVDNDEDAEENETTPQVRAITSLYHLYPVYQEGREFVLPLATEEQEYFFYRTRCTGDLGLLLKRLLNYRLGRPAETPVWDYTASWFW